MKKSIYTYIYNIIIIFMYLLLLIMLLNFLKLVVIYISYLYENKNLVIQNKIMYDNVLSIKLNNFKKIEQENFSLSFYLLLNIINVFKLIVFPYSS
jgi:hypothetical protein